MQKVLIMTLFLLPMALVFSPSVSAQLDFSPNDFSAFQPELVTEPPSPEPGEEVTIKIGNFVSSLQGAAISWRVDGALQETFSGAREITIAARDLGEATTVSATITRLSGQVSDVSTFITPQYVDIIIEPQTHVPDFYLGRPLATRGSQVNLTALVNGAVEPGFVYAWRINNQLMGGTGSLGLYTTSFEMPLDSFVTVKVDIFDGAGNLFASRSVLLPNKQPFIKFYEVNTLYGLSSNAYDSLILSGNSATLQAEPYYLDSRVFNQPDIIEWQVGNRAVSGGSNPYQVTVDRGARSGIIGIDFRVQSTENVLQGAKDTTTVVY